MTMGMTMGEWRWDSKREVMDGKIDGMNGRIVFRPIYMCIDFLLVTIT